MTRGSHLQNFRNGSRLTSPSSRSRCQSSRNGRQTASNEFQYLHEVLVGLHLGQDGFDFAIGSNDESSALGAHVTLAIHAFPHPYVVGIGDPVVLVALNGKGQVVFPDKLLVALDRINADSEEFRLRGDFLPPVARDASLGNATERVFLRIERKHGRFTYQVGEFYDGD